MNSIKLSKESEGDSHHNPLLRLSSDSVIRHNNCVDALFLYCRCTVLKEGGGGGEERGGAVCFCLSPFGSLFPVLILSFLVQVILCM